MRSFSATSILCFVLIHRSPGLRRVDGPKVCMMQSNIFTTQYVTSSASTHTPSTNVRNATPSISPALSLQAVLYIRMAFTRTDHFVNTVHWRFVQSEREKHPPDSACSMLFVRLIHHINSPRHREFLLSRSSVSFKYICGRQEN